MIEDTGFCIFSFSLLDQLLFTLPVTIYHGLPCFGWHMYHNSYVRAGKSFIRRQRQYARIKDILSKQLCTLVPILYFCRDFVGLRIKNWEMKIENWELVMDVGGLRSEVLGFVKKFDWCIYKDIFVANIFARVHFVNYSYHLSTHKRIY